MTLSESLDRPTIDRLREPLHEWAHLLSIDQCSLGSDARHAPRRKRTRCEYIAGMCFSYAGDGCMRARRMCLTFLLDDSVQ